MRHVALHQVAQLLEFHGLGSCIFAEVVFALGYGRTYLRFGDERTDALLKFRGRLIGRATRHKTFHPARILQENAHVQRHCFGGRSSFGGDFDSFY